MRAWGFRHLGRRTLFAALLAFLVVFLVWPILLTVRGGFMAADGGWTLAHLRSVFADPLWMRGLTNSLLIATLTTMLCVVISLPAAVLAARCAFTGKAVLTSMMLLPLVLPPFVGAIGLRAILGRFGALNALLMHLGLLDPDQPGIDFLGGAWLGGPLVGVVIMEALHLYPILYLNLVAALANIDPALEEAAANLGAGRWRRFLRITLPLTLPGLFGGATIVFIWSFTELGTPLMFDFQTVTPVQVFWGIQEMADNPRPYALTVVMLAVAIGLYAIGKLAIAGRGGAMASKGASAANVRTLTGWRNVLAAGSIAALVGVSILPHLGVVISSLSENGAWYRSVFPRAWTGEHYVQALTHPVAGGAIRNSLWYATLAMALCLMVGSAIAYLNVRLKVRGGWVLDTLAMVPLAAPGLVMAFGYVAMTLAWPLGPGGPLAGLVDVVGRDPNPVGLLVIAYAVRRLPYVVRSVSAGLEQTSAALEEAAWTLGAGRLTTLRRIVAPLIMANILAGALLAFSLAMLEVSESLILAQRQEHFPITKAIFELYNRLGDGQSIAAAMGVWGMALLGLTLMGAGLLMGRRLGAVFRV